jgi:pyruvate dehydrogenase E1 component alpha subunit
MLLLRRWNSSASAVFKLSENSFDVHKCPMPSLEATLTKDEAMNLYKTMVNIRRIETASDQVILLL